MFNLNNVNLPGLWYLASPYSRFEGGRHAAAFYAKVVTGALIDNDIHALSPIAYGHHLTPYVQPLEDDEDHERWMVLCREMLAKCDGIIVLTLPGWDTSRGVTEELSLTRWRKKPVWFLNPDTFELTKEELA